jgi:methionine-rich copper-binding protein CopC
VIDPTSSLPHAGLSRRTRTRNRRALTLVVATAAWLAASVGFAATAEAHASLISSSPEDGASITQLPASVTFTFDEDMAQPAFVAVTAPDGTSTLDGDPVVAGATVSQDITTVEEQGIYSMSYRVVSADGHPVTGTITFTVTTGIEVEQVAPRADGNSADAAASGEDRFGSHRTEALIAIAVVVVGIALLFGTAKAARGRGRRQ